MTAKDIMIQEDLDGTGGLIVLREGNDPNFVKRTRDNSIRTSAAWARVLKVLRDEIIALQGAPLAKTKGGK
jgi:hypothetical protein